jgi:LysR family hydrogen peroxide-inducible transcriptional activator
MEPLPSFRHLKHLTAVAHYGHFGRAAAACYVTQSTMSASIKELENVLEATLVDRTKRQVVLTPLGLETVERARGIIDAVEELARAARSTCEPLSGIVRMGVIPTVGPFLLPKVLPHLRQTYNRLKLYLIEDLTARLLDALHQGRLDMVLLALPYECGAAESAILFEDPFLVGMRAAHPLARQERVKPESLSREDLLLLTDGHCLRAHALSVCRFTERRHTEGFEATSLLTLVQMVENGLGTTLLPKLAVEAGILRGTSLVVRPLLAEETTRKIGLVWRSGTRRRNEFRLLADELAKHAESSVAEADDYRI